MKTGPATASMRLTDSIFGGLIGTVSFIAPGVGTIQLRPAAGTGFQVSNFLIE